MAMGTGEVDIEARTTLFTKFCFLFVGRSTASTLHDQYPAIVYIFSGKG